MTRTNSFTIKISLSIILISISIFLFFKSYKEFMKINLDQAISMEDMNINYFDKDAFQKYYEKIDIQNLTDPIFDEEKSENYFESITSEKLFDILKNEKESTEESVVTKDPFENILELENDKESSTEIEENIFNVIKVSKGDNFAKILKKGGLRGRDVDELIINGQYIYDFSKIYLGDTIKIFSKYENDLLEKFQLIYRFSKTKELFVSYKEKEFVYEIKNIPTIDEKIFVSGVIETSLYEAMKKEGLSELIINEVIRIYSFDVDFQRDVYEGDTFEILFNRKKNEKGEVVQISDPEYLMLSSRGTPLTYYLYNNEEFSEYFDENGKGMTKSLMKTPINGARISSSYGMRKHPISGFNKMHKGVDFAAPTGTPIFAAGNGVVEFVGRNGGYGKYIRIRHDSTYKTAYAHLSAYKKGIYGGVRVKQGDIIGYVGSTGNSTGPHLHYEIIVNGKQINPSTLKLPSGRKLNQNQLEDFKAIIANKNLEVEKYKKIN